MRLSTKYTVVPREAASLSIGLSGCTKCETSAISSKRLIIMEVLKLEETTRLTDAGFNIPVRQMPSMQCIVNILAAYFNNMIESIQTLVGRLRTRRVNTTDDKIPQILTIPPVRTNIIFWWDDPLIAFNRQAIKDRFPERPIRDLEL